MTEEETKLARVHFQHVTAMLRDVPLNVRRLVAEMLLTDCQMEQEILSKADSTTAISNSTTAT